jgi:2-oxoglutarate dehydrogenase E1 component
MTMAPHAGQALEKLRNTYCRSIGVQYMHIDDLIVRRWLQRRMESTENRLQLAREEQLRILTRLTDAVVFEEFIRKKFVGAKTFSLDGSESLIPLLDLAIEKRGSKVSGKSCWMAHRGRLNVWPTLWARVPAKSSGKYRFGLEIHSGRGDVSYHLGHSTELGDQLEVKCTSRSVSTPATWNSSIRSPWVAHVPNKTA